jgi:hypothetical protein
MNAPKQAAGNLPDGFGPDSLLTVEQFAAWDQCSVRQVFQRIKDGMPGVLYEGRKHIRIHPRTYLEKRLKTKISAP